MARLATIRQKLVASGLNLVALATPQVATSSPEFMYDSGNKYFFHVICGVFPSSYILFCVCVCLCVDQARVVQKVDNAIHRINHYPVDGVVCFVNIYPLNSDLSGG